MSSQNSDSIPTSVPTNLSIINKFILHCPLRLGKVSVIVIIGIVSFLSYVTWRESNIPSRYSSLGFILVDDDFARPPNYHDEFSVEELTRELGKDRARLFAQLDRDGNGQISISEFEVLVHAVRANPREFLETEKEKSGIVSQVEVVTNVQNGVHLIVEVDDFHIYENNSLDESPTPLLREDLQWVASLFPFGVHNYTVPSEIFAQAFLPFSSDQQSVEELIPGTMFPLIPIGPTFPQNISPKTRFFPGPYFFPREKALHEIVKHFHPTRTFFQSRHVHFHPTAVVVASNEEYYHLVFRLFIEFQISNTSWPFWVTPDSLIGDIVIRKKSHEVVHFTMSQDHHMTALSRFLPPGHIHFFTGSLTLSMKSSNVFPFDEVKWAECIPLDEALNRLNFQVLPIHEMSFMNFASFYHHFTNQYENEIFNNRSYHIVTTRSNLMDHSCQSICLDVRDTIIHPFVQPILKQEFNNVWINAHTLAKTMKSLNISLAVDNATKTPFDIVMEVLMDELKNGQVSVLTVHLNGSNSVPQVRSLDRLERRLEHMRIDVKKMYMNPPTLWERFTQPPEEIRFRDTAADLYRRFLLTLEF